MLREIINNKILIAAVLGWAVAQFLKIFTSYFTAGKVDFSRIIGSGGMPSSHSAFSVALAVKCGYIVGFDSPEFAIALCFALIVMYDAAGVRRAAGNQARILNLIIDDIIKENGIREERLKELIGHTPIEVIAGALLGIIIGIIA
ncbi:divergent PAP2 family protein [Caloramator sp. E03]|uniref:divergent PAP2 family protein n=1 Tax=Caloramator sp. E03 TaxID=2576307 RepID=UPI0011107BA6|nr:divergent PAP2 family protein [Caloramator sp. E03]QCX32691.1 divergent PAP2 family protein [Caloramator sp. E03]